jgi:ankyrin repeat protein
MARKKKAASARPAKPVGEHLKLVDEILRDNAVLQRHMQHSTIDELNDKGGTLLHVACSTSFVGSSDALVKLLLQAGADCNLASTLEGFTPLMLATTADIASCLLDNGADIERECNEGRTALHLACQNALQPVAVVGVLLKRGAEQQILKSSKDGATPLGAAFTVGAVNTVMLLLQHLLAQADFDINNPTLVLDEPLVCSSRV